jgi:hypothetical protein
MFIHRRSGHVNYWSCVTYFELLRRLSKRALDVQVKFPYATISIL